MDQNLNTPITPEISFNAPPEAPKKSNSTLIIILIVVAVILLCCCCVISILVILSLAGVITLPILGSLNSSGYGYLLLMLPH